MCSKNILHPSANRRTGLRTCGEIVDRIGRVGLPCILGLLNHPYPKLSTGARAITKRTAAIAFCYRGPNMVNVE
ncbi:MAG: hypothetical protein Rhims3KO_03750 [Hyphomicrobiales bacterium]